MHDLHIWSITSGFVALSAHLVVNPGTDYSAILQTAEKLLLERFNVRHTTIQFDSVMCDQVHHDAH